MTFKYINFWRAILLVQLLGVHLEKYKFHRIHSIKEVTCDWKNSGDCCTRVTCPYLLNNKKLPQITKETRVSELTSFLQHTSQLSTCHMAYINQPSRKKNHYIVNSYLVGEQNQSVRRAVGSQRIGQWLHKVLQPHHICSNHNVPHSTSPPHAV